MSFRVLILCANDDTINSQKSLRVISSIIKLFFPEHISNDNIEYYYVNAIEEEIEENLGRGNTRTFLANIGEENEELFEDEFFNIIFDEYCPTNFPGIVTQNTFKWFYRILNTSNGWLVMNDFSNIQKDNRRVFYSELKRVLKITDKHELLEHVKTYYDEPYGEDYSLELEKRIDEGFKNILYVYCDRIIKNYYEEILSEIERGDIGFFMIDGKKIKDICVLLKLTRFISIQKNINDHNYLFMRKTVE